MLVKQERESEQKPTSPSTSKTFLEVPQIQNGGGRLPHNTSSISLSSNVSSIGSFNNSSTATGKALHISRFRQYLPQILAVSVKNVVLLAYGMTLGIATIVIPAVDGGNGQNSDDDIILTTEQISWFSKCL